MDRRVHLVIFHMRASGNKQVPDGGDKAGKMRAELFIILLCVHRDILTDLCLYLLQQPRLLTVLQPISAFSLPALAALPPCDSKLKMACY